MIVPSLRGLAELPSCINNSDHHHHNICLMYDLSAASNHKT